jgi:pilus assembly protein TadC
MREDLARQAPVVVDLLAATLASGSAMRPALAAVCAAVDQPAQGVLRPVAAALDLGADASTAWEPLARDPVLGPVAAAVIRSARTGAPLSAMLSRVAGDLRRERRTVVEVAARTAGIRAVLPLAACFLPAFVLLGVVPIVAALAAGLLG